MSEKKLRFYNALLWKVHAHEGDLLNGVSVSITMEFTSSDSSNGIAYTPRVLGGPGLR